MPRKTHPFAKPGRPPGVPKIKPPKLSSGERQGAAPSDSFRSAVPAQTFAKGGAVKYHDDPKFGWGPGKKNC